MFLDKLEGIDTIRDRQSWAARWGRIADAHCLAGDLSTKKGAFDEAIERWLCALTTFEVARRLLDEDDVQSGEVSIKIEAVVNRFRLSTLPKLERVQIKSYDHAEFSAYYMPAGSSDVCAPAAICISREDEAGAALLARLLPVAIGRGISVLVVSHDDLSNSWRGQSDFLLSCSLDYLAARSDVDATRIGVYGEGHSAVLATNFAVSDRRLAAAVCDGGLWNWARTRASVGWITRTFDIPDDHAASVERSRMMRQIRCPVLVVTGGRGAVCASEAVKLQADCMAARIDVELAMTRMARTPGGEIENFVVSDGCIFEWLERRLVDRALAIATL